MKKLSRDEMKKVMGGVNAPVSGLCDEYEGQTTWTCGTRYNAGICYVDTCDCSGNVLACETPVPGAC